MARLLVEIDEHLKKELKIRLVREGETLKSWLTRMAAGYVGQIHPPGPTAAGKKVPSEVRADSARTRPREARANPSVVVPPGEVTAKPPAAESAPESTPESAADSAPVYYRPPPDEDDFLD